MTVIATAANLALDLVMVLCTAFVALFIFLAYFEPMTLDMLVHQAHDVIPPIIDATIDNIKSIF